MSDKDIRVFIGPAEAANIGVILASALKENRMKVCCASMEVGQLALAGSHYID